MVSKNWRLFGAGLSSFWRWEKRVRGRPEQKISSASRQNKKKREKNEPDPLFLAYEYSNIPKKYVIPNLTLIWKFV